MRRRQEVRGENKEEEPNRIDRELPFCLCDKKRGWCWKLNITDLPP